jgi:choline-sulfatase
METVGERLDESERAELPGTSLVRLANGETPQRTVLSEYHAVGAITGCFMIRNGRWKYVHYVGQPPQLFDLEADPYETRDLGHDPAHAAVVAECERRLRSVVDPEEATDRAFRDQARIIAENGGEAAIVARGEFSHTPAPGEEAVYG